MGLLVNSIQYFDTTALDYPYYSKGSLDRTNALGPVKCAEKEVELNNILHQKGSLASSSRIVFRDDADLLYAENIISNYNAEKQDKRAQSLARTRESNAARNVNTGEVTLDSKIYISSTTPPPSIANEQSTTPIHSVKEVSKLSAVEKEKLEVNTGIEIDSDAALRKAKDLIISNSRSKQLGVTGTKKDGTRIVTSDAKTIRTIDKLLAQIEAIEATREDCPDWLGCPLPDIDFTKLKKKLESLLSLQKFADAFAKAKEMVEKGLYTVSQFSAWLKCPTYLFKEGLEGLQTLNEVGQFVSGLQNTEYMRVFKETVGEMGITKLLPNSNSKDSLFATLGSSTSKQHISFSDYMDLFRTFKEGGVDFDPRAIFSPFEDEEYNTNYRTHSNYDFSDTVAISTSFGYVESTKKSTQRVDDPINNNNVSLFASAMAKTQEDYGEPTVDVKNTTTLISMNRALASQTTSGNFPDQATSKENEFIRFSSYAYPNTTFKELETFTETEAVLSVVQQQKKAAAVSDALYTGDMDTANALGGLETIYQTQQQLDRVFWKPSSIHDKYRRVYSKIEQSALA